MESWTVVDVLIYYVGMISFKVLSVLHIVLIFFLYCVFSLHFSSYLSKNRSLEQLEQPKTANNNKQQGSPKKDAVSSPVSTYTFVCNVLLYTFWKIYFISINVCKFMINYLVRLRFISSQCFLVIMYAMSKTVKYI